MKFFERFTPKKEEQKNPLKSEHLREGVRPIMACIGTPEQFRDELNGIEPEEVLLDSSSEENSNRNIDWYGDPEELNKQKIKNAGAYSYVMSSIDDLSKFSKSFKNCTGLIVTGTDKETGKNISFLTHQDPEYFLNFRKFKNKLTDDLRTQLEELKKRCEGGTIDAVIVGGNYFENKTKFQENYIQSIELLSKEVKNVLGFEPVVMTGPKTEMGKGGQDDVFFDNDNRRLYIMRREVGKDATKSYLPSDIEEKRREW